MTEVEGKDGKYVEVKLEVDSLKADAVCNYIIDNICNGLVLEEEEDSSITTIKFYVPRGQHSSYRKPLAQYLACLVDDDISAVPQIHERPIETIDWVEAYRKSVKSLIIADDIVVRPPWSPSPLETPYEIILDPKMAFGTGSHETTRSCLEVIRERFQPSTRFLDMGCGSGILSILADKMGASFIKAVDYDITAVENCRENFGINKLAAEHEIELGSIEKCDGDAPYDFVCANIIRSTILQILDRLAALTSEPGTLVLSGLLQKDQSEVEAALRECGLDQFVTVDDNEWVTFVVTRG